MTDATDPGLDLRQQAPVSAAATVTIGADPPADVWRDLAATDGFQRALVDAARDALADTHHSERAETLCEAGVTAAGGGYATVATAFDLPPEHERHRDAIETSAAFGQGEPSILGHLPLDAVGDGPLAILDLADATPTLCVRVERSFRDARAEHRRRTCELLAALANAVDLRVVASPIMQRWLATAHRADLPGVSEQVTTHRQDGDPEARAEDVLGALDPDGREMRVLRDLAAEPGETLTYNALYAEHATSRSRVRQVVGRLADLGLVETFDAHGGRAVELTAAGSAFAELVDTKIGRQQRVSEIGNGCVKSRVARPAHGDDPQATDGPRPYLVRPMKPATRIAAAASATDDGVVLVDHPVEPTDDARTHNVAFDEAEDEAIVSVHGSGPFPYVVSLAVALASPQLLDQALPASRIEEIEDPPVILREARQIGWLSDDALADGDVLRDELVEAGVKIQDLTREFRHGEYDHRGVIMQLSHGLAGAITHLLDVVGIDLVREIRVPGGLNREKELKPMARSIAISAAIQARYGAFATFRQLFEEREGKRESTLTPEVDASDPFGEVIGSFVIRGPDLHRFEGYLRDALEAPADVHEDAPEIAIRFPITRADHRSAYAEAVRRMCQTRNLDATREAVSFFQAFTGSVYDATRSIGRLQREQRPRPIQEDEIRYGLAEAVPPDRVLPDAPPTMSKAVHAMLTASEPLTQTELAERAGVTTRSVRKHAPKLAAFDLIERTDVGFRLALPFREERGPAGDRHLPWYLTPNRDRDDYRDATEKGVLWEAVGDLDLPGEQVVMDALGRLTTVQIPAEVRSEIGGAWPWALPLLEAVRALAANEPARRPADVVIAGNEIEQTALPAETADPEEPHP